MKAWLTGKIISEESLLLDPRDEGIRYGSGLFETLRIYKSRAPFLGRHLERMADSAGRLGFQLPYSIDRLIQAGIDLIQANALEEGVLRFYCSAGGAVWATATTGIPYPDQRWGSGMTARLVSIRRNETSPLVGLKTFNYLDNILAKRQAKAEGFGEALFLNSQGFLTEGSTSNIFLVKDGILLTPSPASGLLPGIARETVLNLKMLPVEERKIRPEEIRTADECFLTNSLMEVMPLISVDGQFCGSGRPGAITQKIAAGYRKLILSSHP